MPSAWRGLSGGSATDPAGAGAYRYPNDGRVVSNFIVQALRNQPTTLFGDGTQTRYFCYVPENFYHYRDLSVRGDSGRVPGFSRQPTYPDREHLVIDGASLDGTRAVLEARWGVAAGGAEQD